jgi:hypothetical protein
LTQEAAAQRLPIDVRTLQRYEQNELECPASMYPIIAKEYGDRKLLFRALQSFVVWKELLPEANSIPLTQAACALLDSVIEIGKYQQEILKIVSDGRVLTPELYAWAKVTETVKKLICSGVQLLEATEGGER